jgi:SWIB/MDM2 domain-containing protein
VGDAAIVRTSAYGSFNGCVADGPIHWPPVAGCSWAAEQWIGVADWSRSARVPPSKWKRMEWACCATGMILHRLTEVRQSMAGKPNSALLKPVELSPELQKIVGDGPMPRGEVTKKVWDYIKQNGLQNPENKRNIKADDKLRPIFKKDEVTMFEMTKLISAHLR